MRPGDLVITADETSPRRRRGGRQAIGDATGAPELPRWFTAGLAAVIGWVGIAGTVGVLMLTYGGYHPGVVVAVATAGAVGLAVVVARQGSTAQPAHGAAVAAIAIAACFLVLAGAFHSEHLLTDRDPGVYVNIGRSIARANELHPIVRSGPYLDAHAYATGGASFGASAQGRLSVNFLPMLPVLLALGWSIGGDTGLLLVPVVLGTIGLLACYALVARVLSARAALVALALLAIVPLELWFARDAYSELVVQVLVFGGVWLYVTARDSGSVTLAAAGGGAIATTALARIDAPILIVGLVTFVALEWVRADSDAKPTRARRVVLSFGGAIVLGSLLALHVAQRVARGYFNALHNELHQLEMLLALAVIGLVAVIVVHRMRPGLGRAIGQSRALPVAAAVLAGVVAVWAYFFRPDPVSDLPDITRSRRISGTLRYAFNRWHWSRSVHWFTSYFGVVGAVAAFFGLVLLGLRAWRGSRAASALFLLVVPSALLYLARPSISSDQPWAMRRYLPVVIPGIAIAIAVALVVAGCAAWHVRGAITRPVAVGGVVVLTIAAVVPVAIAARPFVRARAQHGAESAIHAICRRVGDDSAVLVYGAAYLDLELPQTLRGFCGVPVAEPARGTTPDLAGLAAAWQSAGRQLYVATGQPELLEKHAPEAELVLHVAVADQDNLERTFDRRPTRRQPTRRDIFVFRLPAASSSNVSG